MLLITCLGFLAVASALPTQQILAPALTAIPAANHILILTPQAQVQLDPSLRYPQPLVQHLAPVARIDSPTDQTVVYYPNENLVNAFSKDGPQSKQLENANISNIINQVASFGQTAQAQLEAFQQQLSQGLEGLIQPTGQKIEDELVELKPVFPADQFAETARQAGGRYYGVSNIPQFYNNFDVIHPVNPLFTVGPYQAIRARSIAHPEDKTLVNAPLLVPVENTNLATQAVQDEKPEVEAKPQESDSQARSVDNLKIPAAQPHPESAEIKSHTIEKENEQVADNSQFGKFIGSLENSADSQETGSNKKEAQDLSLKEQNKGSELVSFAEALPAGLAISGEGGLSQAKPVASAIVGKDGVAYSAPSGTAIAGSTNTEQSSQSS